MNCKQARRLMHDLLDGAPVDRATLDQHLGECGACHATWEALQRLATELEGTLRCEVPPVRLERATRRVLRALETRRPASPARLTQLAAAAAVLIAVFSAGLYGGRTVWPREVIVPQIVKVLEVREKIVEVEVPVIKERVVVKRVPVIRERIVYRDREVSAGRPMAEAETRLALAAEGRRAYAHRARVESPEPVKCREIVIHLASSPNLAPAQVRHEIRPARLVSEGESEEASPTEGHREQPDSAITQFGETAIALVPSAPSL